MGKVLNAGSLNIDYVYKVPRLAGPGETVKAEAMETFAGGKGLNQSVALVLAGAKVMHLGRIGEGGEFLINLLKSEGVDTGLCQKIDGPSGHAIIQVDPSGENSIIVHPGANHSLNEDDVKEAMNTIGPGDAVLAQNETSAVGEIIRIGAARGARVFFNPAPMTEAVKGYPLEMVSHFIVNRREGEQLTGVSEVDEVLAKMVERFPRAAVTLTMGAEGSVHREGGKTLRVPARKVIAVDATGAGDTFIGYLIAGLMDGVSVKSALGMASLAAAVAVTRPGAARSIPRRAELNQ